MPPRSLSSRSPLRWARVRAVAAGDGADAGSVRVLVVPSAVSEQGRLRFDQLVPNEDTLQKITDRLE